ncbi:hypothetical protein [Stutzerimonas stutzeri]|uniref:hypothetical protein n=1 Tax=Stutzerimonas stutzeri TaxID=316 RepID=UPI000F735222|nr:hypothetical protein [Stutzerimonas stutzeri]RRW19086.1 hypothetical protein EGJ43_08590 [Stutzerimonas stutzeri]
MFGKSSHTFEINYIYQNDPRAETYDADVDVDSLSQGEAARHLIQLHNADAENSLVMPKADADEAQLLEQAEVMGITDIRVTRVHKHEKGDTPGHYKQP